MKKKIVLLAGIALLWAGNVAYAQFSIKAGGCLPFVGENFSGYANDFKQEQIGVYAGLEGNIHVWDHKREHTDHSIGITLNADYMWNTWNTAYRQKISDKYTALYTNANVSYVHYMNIPVMIGLRYKMQASNHSVGMSIDAAVGCDLLYRTPLKVGYKLAGKDMQYKEEYNLSYGVAARAGICLLAGDHFCVGVHYHLLHISNNSGVTSLSKMPSGEEVEYNEWTNDNVKLFSHTFGFSIGVIF